MDRSIVRPVLDAINGIRSAPRDLAVYYRIVDLFCARWLGRPRAEMSLEDEESIYLAHELLREFLRFEGNNRRVALWLLTINRCCRNMGTDLSRIGMRFARAVRGADLDFDRTLLAPILERVRLFESSHTDAVTERLGESDAIGPFYQWIGIYSTYVYPRLRQDPRARDRVMVSTLAFLISEFISLKDNVSRVAALLLAIKEACAYGQPTGEPGISREPGRAADGTISAGAETEIVEEILERLRAESGGEVSTPKRISQEGTGPIEKRILAAAGEMEKAPSGSLPLVMESLELWSRNEMSRDGRRLDGSVEALISRESQRSQNIIRKIAAGFRTRPQALRPRLEGWILDSDSAGRGHIALLVVLGFIEALLHPHRDAADR